MPLTALRAILTSARKKTSNILENHIVKWIFKLFIPPTYIESRSV